MPINSVDIHSRSLRAGSPADVLRHLLPLGAQKCQRLIQLVELVVLAKAHLDLNSKY